MAETGRTERRERARRHADDDYAMASFAVEHAAIAIFILDEQARIVRANREACRSLGYTERELLSLTLHDITAGFDMELWPDHWRTLQREGAAVLADVHRRKDGALVDVEVHANLLRFQGRELNVAFALDLTERNRTRDALGEHERMLSTLFDNLPGMAYRCAPDRRRTMVFVSDGCLRLTGRAPAEFIGNGAVAYADIIHPQDRDQVSDEVSAALARREPWTITYRLVMPDDRLKWVWERGVGVLDADDTLLHLEGFTTDVSELRRAEAALRESENLYRTLFQQAPVGVLLYDADLVIRDCNESFAQIVGASRDQLIGFGLATSPDSRPLDALRRPIAGGNGVYEGPYTTATTGRDLWIALKTSPHFGAEGEPAGAIAVVSDRTRQRRAEDEMERLRLHDAVTGLPNRSVLLDRIAQALAHAQRRRLGFAVAAVAIDRFTSLVNTLGHDTCDRLLAAAAERLTTTMRTEDTVACLAGSELGLLLAGVGGPAQASASVEKIVGAFALPFEIDGHELFLSLSIGVAVYPADGADPQDLIENAEVAARRASSQGGNGWQFFHAGMNDERAGSLALEGELHRALEREQFVLHYQPIVEASGGTIVGLEALLRWERPGNGLVQPPDFMDAAEETGLMVPIGAWVLRTACAQARAWSRSLRRPLRISVNLSARQMYDASLAETVRAALKASGLPARQLELEITETAAMRDPQQAGRILSALRTRSVRIALDDFGTGYSSLSHLVRLPIATVKIDRSFVRDLLSVPEHAAVAASVIALGHRLGLTVVAEGVETQGEREFLRDEGCDALQGYLFSRPLPPDECARVLEAGPIVP